VTGGGSFGGLSSNQIYQGTGSNVNVASTQVTVGIAGAGNVASFAAVGTTIAGNLTVRGDLTVTGNSVNIGSATLSIQDPIISLNTPADLSPLTTPTTNDIGLKFHYYDTADSHALLGRDAATGYLEWFSRGDDVGNVFTGGTFGTIKSGAVILANARVVGGGLTANTGTMQVYGDGSISGNLFVGATLTATTLTATTTNPTTVNAGTVNAATINVTSGNITTLTATTTNPTTVNAGTVNAATLNATNGNITNANHTTMVSTNFSSGNIQATSNITLTGSIIPSSNVSSNLGNSTNWFNTFFGVATQAKYADLAENYQADKPYNPGTVLQFGGTAEVTVAEANTPRVAGVVSTNPAHLMNGALAGNGVVAVALTGRVPCNVIGPIAKGDMLVSAGFGFARADTTPAMGTVIGKALEDFPINAKGIIEVVVGRL
jgi:hypothetical protein